MIQCWILLWQWQQHQAITHLSWQETEWARGNEAALWTGEAELLLPGQLCTHVPGSAGHWWSQKQLSLLPNSHICSSWLVQAGVWGWVPHAAPLGWTASTPPPQTAAGSVTEQGGSCSLSRAYLPPAGAPGTIEVECSRFMGNEGF